MKKITNEDLLGVIRNWAILTGLAMCTFFCLTFALLYGLYAYIFRSWEMISLAGLFIILETICAIRFIYLFSKFKKIEI